MTICPNQRLNFCDALPTTMRSQVHEQAKEPPTQTFSNANYTFHLCVKKIKCKV